MYMVAVMIIFKERDVVVRRYIFADLPNARGYLIVNHLSAVLDHQDKVIYEFKH